MPEIRFAKDVDRNGLVNTNDGNIVEYYAALNDNDGVVVGDTDYYVDADINNDGIIDGTDKSLMSGILATPLLSEGEFSKLSGLPLRIGLAGYHWVPRLEMYLARNRYMDPRIGRWITRDPKG